MDATITLNIEDDPVIKKEYAQSVFDMANGFYEAALRSGEAVPNGDDGGTLAPMTPMIVCFSFASELYLKSLISNQGEKAKKLHGLNDLYLALTADTKKILSENYKKKTGKSVQRMKDDIKQFSYAFMDWRYVFEKENLQEISVQNLVSFSQSLYITVRSLNPNWLVQKYLDSRIMLAESPTFHVVRRPGGGFLRISAKK